jgi:hypothetical protein
MVITFDPTVEQRSKSYSSFRSTFSLKYLWNPYSLKRRSCRARTEYRLKWAKLLIRPLDRPQSFTLVFGARFPRSTYGMPTR